MKPATSTSPTITSFDITFPILERILPYRPCGRYPQVKGHDDVPSVASCPKAIDRGIDLPRSAHQTTSENKKLPS
jgi:hypothetical protein